MTSTRTNGLKVLVTGAAGYIGEQAAIALSRAPNVNSVIATDIVTPKAANLPGGATLRYEQLDICEPAQLTKALQGRSIDVVMHLAAALPQRGGNAELGHRVNVDGTENVLKASVAAGVGRIIVSSSGSAYGFHADNPCEITEDQPLRGNTGFPYSDQKRQVEDLLARYRREQPNLQQTILRLAAVIGPNVKNQISEFFEMPVVIGVRGHVSPFRFIWDQDVVNCLVLAALNHKPGIFNVAGDGSVPLSELAKIMGKTYLPVPEWLFANTLRGLRPLRLAPWGPEQLCFLKYRVVMSNARLKRDFGYFPRKTSLEAFNAYWAAQADHRRSWRRRLRLAS